MADPLQAFAAWILTLNGQKEAYLKSVAVPTENSMVIGFNSTLGGALDDWAFQEMQGQRRIMAGNLITLDTSLHPVYCDAWDSAFIQQAEMAACDASQSALMHFTLNLQVTNLREVPIPSPGASAAGQARLVDSRKSQLRQRLFGRTIRSNLLPAHTGRKDHLPYFVSNVTVSGSSKEIFVKKLGTLTYSSGVIAPFVITMGEDQAADCRAWKQAGGQRDVTIGYLDTALRICLTIVFGGCTIAQIVPAVPISVSGPTSVTLNVSRLTINY
jgi:hypothetical protein